MFLKLFLFIFCIRRCSSWNNNNKRVLEKHLDIGTLKVKTIFVCVCSFSGGGGLSWPDPWSKRQEWRPCCWKTRIISLKQHNVCVWKIWIIFFQFPWLWISHGHRKPKDQKWVVKHFKFPTCNVNNIRCESYRWTHGWVPAGDWFSPFVYFLAQFL